MPLNEWYKEALKWHKNWSKIKDLLEKNDITNSIDSTLFPENDEKDDNRFSEEIARMKKLKNYFDEQYFSNMNQVKQDLEKFWKIGKITNYDDRDFMHNATIIHWNDWEKYAITLYEFLDLANQNLEINWYPKWTWSFPTVYKYIKNYK